MKTSALMRQSRALMHFRLILYVLIICGVIYGLYCRFEMGRANIEQQAFSQKIALIKRILYLEQALIQARGENKCQHNVLKQKNIIPSQALSMSALANARQVFGLDNHWQVLKKGHALIYSVRSNTYFKSRKGPFIEVRFLCTKGDVIVKISPHQWCQEKKWWGCALWQAD